MKNRIMKDTRDSTRTNSVTDVKHYMAYHFYKTQKAILVLIAPSTWGIFSLL